MDGAHPENAIRYFAVIGAEAKANDADSADPLPVSVLQRYPLEDHSDCRFPPALASFCFPRGGAQLLSQEEEVSDALHGFVLTNEAGERVFGAALHIWCPHGSGCWMQKEPVRVGKTIVEEAVNVKGVKGVEMESTVPVVPVPKQTVTSDGGEVKAMPREEPGSFVDRDVMKAVEKARAAVVELQRHAGLLEGPSVSDTNSVATTQVRSCSPFCQEAVGLNILLSHDGYTATRSSGCRQSVAVCKAPLSLQAEGWYFEVEVLQTVDGWLGGLGIGVTQADPSEMKDQRLPDKACRMPKTYILGYVGSKYLNGSCEFIDWQPGLLQVGQRVGLLIARTTNDLVVNVDGEEVAKVSGDDLRSKGFSTEPMYGIVDVYNATLSIRLLAGAVAPSRKGH